MLVERNTALQVGENGFVRGGVLPDHAGAGLETINVGHPPRPYHPLRIRSFPDPRERDSLYACCFRYLMSASLRL